MIAISAVVSVFTVAVFLIARMYPIWPRRFQGCDAFNILMNARQLRKSRRLPIRMPPVFLLEEQDQWYPPGFLILCALLPEAWLEKRYWLINHVIDLVITSYSIHYTKLYERRLQLLPPA